MSGISLNYTGSELKHPKIRFDVQGDQNIMISPALFVPLVENAFKFASFRMKKPCVDIRLSVDKGIVEFEVYNNYETRTNVSKSDHSGYGLINLKKRLDLIYSGKHQLTIKQDDQVYHVKLIIDTNAD